jgi:adenosylmethionine-8-amino-7-oxononanoate aminotransferase
MPARRREPRVLARELPAELQVAATNGSIVTDSRDRKYIDFVMGWCVGNFGWRPAVIAKAIERFKGPDYVYPGYSYAPWTELARLLASLPPSVEVMFPRDRWVRGGRPGAAGGDDSHRPPRISFEGSYHGNSLAGLSIGASDNASTLRTCCRTAVRSHRRSTPRRCAGSSSG